MDAAGNLQIDVRSSVLPTDAATAAFQAAMLPYLARIDDLQHALQSVATDRLIVRGEDQLFSFESRIMRRKSGVISGAGGFFDSDSPPDGFIWAITSISGSDITSPTTEHIIQQRSPIDVIHVHRQVEAFAAVDFSIWGGHLFLQHDDFIRVHFVGALAADQCRIDLGGYVMTVEV